jgi:hypothetical protein
MQAQLINACYRYTSHNTHCTQRKIIPQNSELNKKSVTTVRKVQQFHQNSFSAPDDSRIGLNILCWSDK